MAGVALHRPVRAVGFFSLTAISVNTVIGAGIFALPANVAQILGPAGVWAYFAAGAAVLLIALCFAEAGSRLEESGGPYVYTREAFGPFAGFEMAWIFLLARLTALAAVSNTFAAYLGYFCPPLQHGAGRVAAITVMIAGLAATHWFGVRLGTMVNNVFTAGKLLPLLAFCAAGVVLLPRHGLAAAPLPPPYSLQQASLLLMFAFGGFESATVPSEEVIDPKRQVPAAILASVSFVVLLYLLIQVVSQAALPDLAGSTTPLAAAAGRFLGPAGAWILTVAALFSTGGTNHANLFVGPRLLYALGRDGCLPVALTRLHPRYRTPSAAILLYAVTAWILAVSSAFAPLAALSAITRVLVYTGTCLAVPFLRRRAPAGGRQFTLPGGALFPLLALGVCVWLLTGSTLRQFLAALIALFAGAALYAVMRARLTARRPAAVARARNSVNW